MARILLVDDDAMVRQVVTDMLSVLGDHQVTQAADGQSALALLASGQYDLVLTDLIMKGMLGDELVAKIRSAGWAVPVIVLTGVARPPSIPGANVVLPKPVRLAGLEAALVRTLG